MKTQYTADNPAKAEKGNSPATATKKSGGGNGLSLVALALAAAGIGGSYYNHTQITSQSGTLAGAIDERFAENLSDTQKLEERATALEATTASLSGEMEAKASELTATLEARAAELQSKLEAAQTAVNASLDTHSQELTGMVDSKTSELSVSLQDTQMKLNRNQRSWLLSEIEYLLRTSVHRVMLAGDTDSAVEALKAAKSQLAVLGEVEYLPVAKAIGAEITELRGADQPDIEQLILDLRSLSDSTTGLRMPVEEIAAPAETAAETKVAAAEETASSGIGSTFSGLLKNIQKNVSVKTPEGTTFGSGDRNAVFAPTTEESTNAELIKLNLQAAQLAALRRDQKDYSAQLDKARANVQSIYDQGAETTAAFIRQLDLLTEKTVVPYTDKLGGALRLLRETNKTLGAN